MKSPEKLKGLYAITEDSSESDSLISRVEQALKGGARIVQYRDKSSDHDRRLRECRSLVELCSQYAVPLIVNDDTELARATNAGGVHLGREDGDLVEARKKLGDDAIIGISCYNRMDLAVEAVAAGADYIAFGRFFPSSTKPDAVQADTDLLRQARETLGVPMVAIGGITPENGGFLIDAGADMLAVVHGIFGQADVQDACSRFTRLFRQTEILPS